jgi:hypothetical protein
VKHFWWIALSTIGCGLVAAGLTVYSLRPYYRLMFAGMGAVSLVIAILGAAMASRTGIFDDD